MCPAAGGATKPKLLCSARLAQPLLGSKALESSTSADDGFGEPWAFGKRHEATECRKRLSASVQEVLLTHLLAARDTILGHLGLGGSLEPLQPCGQRFCILLAAEGARDPQTQALWSTLSHRPVGCLRKRSHVAARRVEKDRERGEPFVGALVRGRRPRSGRSLYARDLRPIVAEILEGIAESFGVDHRQPPHGGVACAMAWWQSIRAWVGVCVGDRLKGEGAGDGEKYLTCPGGESA